MAGPEPTSRRLCMAAVFAVAVFGGDCDVRAAQVVYPDRDKVTDYLAKCYRPQTGAGIENFGHYVDMMHELQKNSGFARTLFGEIARRDVIYCSSAGGIAPFSGGAWYGEYGVVGIGAMDIRDHKKTALLHESMHALQFRDDLAVFRPNLDVGYWMKGKLYGEAAGMTAEIIAAFEAWQKKDTAHWDYLLQGGTTFEMPGVMKAFEDAYATARREKKTHDRALEMAGAAAWNKVFLNGQWLDFYTDHALYSFVRLHDYYKAPEKTKSIRVYRDKAALSGRLNDHFNFTRDVAPLSIDGILPRGNALRPVFDLVRHWQYSQIYGAEAPEVRDQEKAMTRAGNPYLGLDVREAVRRKQDKGGTLAGHLDQMARDRAAPSPEARPSGATPK